jgi:uncharacterized membrane protein
MGFLSAPSPVAVQRHVPGSVSVFVPTTPNPTTGFLIIVAPDLIREVDMSVDEAFTYILSAGAVGPDGPMRPAAGADEGALPPHVPAAQLSRTPDS